MSRREIREAREQIDGRDDADMMAGCRGSATPHPVFVERTALNFPNARALDFVAFRAVRGCMNCSGQDG